MSKYLTHVLSNEYINVDVETLDKSKEHGISQFANKVYRENMFIICIKSSTINASTTINLTWPFIRVRQNLYRVL